ncbi:MAG: hypothetical protein EBU93_01275 [Chlamydiae bacterium]|jgi:hypothetical protein|nr:hypothetical protein [Chlamydiota bacterium]
MRAPIKYLFSSIFIVNAMNGYGEEVSSQNQNANKQLINKQEAIKLSNLSQSQNQKVKPIHPDSEKGTFKSFTGKVVGSNVRLRTHADTESAIVRGLEKDELLVITGEKNDFYMVQPPQDVKAYVFRSFVLDNVVEGNRVNVRLSPETDAPVVGNLCTGDKVEGKISEKNPKWLEIAPPSTTVFFIAKEYVDFVGGPEVKPIQDKRKETLNKLMDAAHLASQSEMNKSFEEIDFERLASKFRTIMTEYKDFPDHVSKASQKLSLLQETYLQKKLVYLENKTNMLTKELSQEKVFANQAKKTPSPEEPQRVISRTDRMKIWEPLEQALFLSWAAINHAKTMNDFYTEQKSKAVALRGQIEVYGDPVKNKPGDFVIKDKDLPVAYIYSTQIDLDQYVGKQVNLLAYPRPNNSFAFPAYYVFDVAH